MLTKTTGGPGLIRFLLAIVATAALASCVGFGELGPDRDASDARAGMTSDARLLVSIQPSPTVDTALRRDRIEQPLLVYPHLAIDRPVPGKGGVGDGIFDAAFMDAYLDKLLAKGAIDRDRPIHVILDWEAPLDDLREDPNSEVFKRTQTQMLKAIKHVRTRLPRAWVSYYGLPSMRYWLKEDDGRVRSHAKISKDALRNARELALQPTKLFEEMDFISPTIYDPYPDVRSNGSAKDDHAHAREVTRLALAVSQGKPVFPFVSHRFYPSFELIEMNEFLAHVRAVLTTEFQGRRPMGVIWWCAERSWISEKRLPEKERTPGKTWEQHIDKVQLTRLRALQKLIAEGEDPATP